MSPWRTCGGSGAIALLHECDRLEGCLFFNDGLNDMPATADMYKITYCLGHNEECARHMVMEALGPDFVPADLFPNDEARARDIIAG